MKSYFGSLVFGLGLANLCVAQIPATVTSTTANATQSIQATQEIRLLPGFSTAQQDFQASIVLPVSEIGQWSPKEEWYLYGGASGLIGIHTHVLPNGKVLTWQGHNDNAWNDPAHPHRGTDAYLWISNQSWGYNPLAIHFDESNAFCTGHSFLADGRLLVAGGHSHNEDQATPPYILGLPHVTTYSVATNDFAAPQNMGRSRWYPTNTTLSTGEVLITSGETEPDVIDANPPVFFPEVWSNGTIRRLTTANGFQQPLYPMMFALSGGRAFYAGPGDNTRFLTSVSSTGAWGPEFLSPTGYRAEGSAVMYAPNKILLVGGRDGNAVKNSTQLIDLTNAVPPNEVPAFIAGAPMEFRRHHVNATLLPDGTVLVTGGSGVAGQQDPGQAILPAEIWTPPGAALPGGGTAPAGGSFRTVAAMAVPRQYHSTAVLLPDGRVLSAGGEEFIHPTFTAGVGNNPNAEIYSPPYLFKGPRPVISVAPSMIQYAQPFVVRTSNVGAAPVTRATMIRLSSVTHSFNMNQRFNEVPLVPLSGSPGGFTLTPPPSADVCPPGHYLLFLLTPDGVPSEAKIVQISASACNSTLNVAVGVTGDACTKPATATITTANLAADYRWTINGLAAPQFNDQPTASAILNRCNPSASFQVSATALCSGVRVSTGTSVTRTFGEACQCGTHSRPAQKP